MFSRRYNYRERYCYLITRRNGEYLVSAKPVEWGSKDRAAPFPTYDTAMVIARRLYLSWEMARTLLGIYVKRA